MTNTILSTLLAEGKYRSTQDVLRCCTPEETVRLFAEMAETDPVRLPLAFRMLDKDQSIAVITNWTAAERAKLAAGLLSLTEEEWEMLDSENTLSELPASLVHILLQDADREHVNRVAGYGEDTAGAEMTTDFIELPASLTVEAALGKIRKSGLQQDTIYTCYVTDSHKMLGVVTVKSLLLHDDAAQLTQLMDTDFPFIQTGEDIETAANRFRQAERIAIPVLDNEGCIVGILSYDDAIQVLTSESTEDIQKMAAIEADETPYMETTVWSQAKHRIVWLLVLMFTGIFTGMIISHYEDAFAAVPLLVSFIPQLMDTGGNCGSQSSVMIIRGLAMDELHFSDFGKVVWKEFRISLIVSGILSVANCLRVYIMYQNFLLAVTVGLAMLFTVIIAKLVGCSLPMLAKKIGLDPAIMASPMITTIVDILSIMIYFNFATHILSLG